TERFFLSTSRSTSKKLRVRVRPGVFETRTSFRRAHSVLIIDDLPTFERPAKATSGSEGLGHCCSVVAVIKNRASSTRIMACGASWLVEGHGFSPPERLVRSTDQWSIALSFVTKSNGLSDGELESWHVRQPFSDGSESPTSRDSSP